MLPGEIFENLHTVMVILASDGIQNFKNRFSFVSYLLTTTNNRFPHNGLMSVKKKQERVRRIT